MKSLGSEDHAQASCDYCGEDNDLKDIERDEFMCVVCWEQIFGEK